jgi:hypothetical protein
MRNLFTSLVAGSLAIGTFGCGPGIPEEELGTVVTNPADLPGAAEDYDLGLPPPKADAKKEATPEPPAEG